jgi:hypothetical protein
LIRENDQLADTIFLRIYELGLRNSQALNYFEKHYYDPTRKFDKKQTKSYESRLLDIAKLGAKDAFRNKDPLKGGNPRFYAASGTNGEYADNGRTRLKILEDHYGTKEKWQENQ